MNNLFRCFVLLLIALSCHAQKIRFTDQGNEWSVVGLNGSVFREQIRYGTDTTIDGQTYKQVYRAGGIMARYFVREDTSVGKVYYRDYSHTSDTEEYILYDYNLKPGDTFRPMPTKYNVLDSVLSIDSVSVLGFKYKIYKIGPAHNANEIQYTFIEGIGETNDPFFRMSNVGVSDYWISLVCFSNNGFYPPVRADVDMFAYYKNPNFVNGVDCNLATDIVEERSDAFAVFPNPANDIVTLLTAQTTNAISFSVYDMAGKCILNKNNQSGKVSVNTSSWSTGFYLFVITDAIHKSVRKEMVRIDR